jgi:hypothetical protein
LVPTSAHMLGRGLPWVDRVELITQRGLRLSQRGRRGMTALLVVAQQKARRWRIARPEREPENALGAPPQGPRPGQCHWRRVQSRPRRARHRPATAINRWIGSGDRLPGWERGGRGTGREAWDGRVEQQPDPERTGRESRGKTWLGRGGVDLVPKQPVARRDLRLVAQDGQDGRSDRRTGCEMVQTSANWCQAVTGLTLLRWRREVHSFAPEGAILM